MSFLETFFDVVSLDNVYFSRQKEVSDDKDEEDEGGDKGGSLQSIKAQHFTQMHIVHKLHCISKEMQDINPQTFDKDQLPLT